MQLSVDSKDLDFKTRTVVEYWRANIPPFANMSDNDILESLLRYAIEDELANIAKNVIDSKMSK